MQHVLQPTLTCKAGRHIVRGLDFINTPPSAVIAVLLVQKVIFEPAFRLYNVLPVRAGQVLLDFLESKDQLDGRDPVGPK